MEEYAQAWVAGYGSKLVARPPFEVARLGDSERVVFARHAEEGVRQVMVAPNPTSAAETRIALGPGTASKGDVFAFVEPDEREAFEAAWRIGTREYECAWPRGWTLWSTPLTSEWPFELTATGDAAPADAMIYVRGPWETASLPALDEFVAEGMHEVGRRQLDTPRGPCNAIDIAYELDGEAWLQFRMFAPLDAERSLLVTAQAPVAAAAPVIAAAEALAADLRPRVSAVLEP